MDSNATGSRTQLSLNYCNVPEALAPEGSKQSMIFPCSDRCREEVGCVVTSTAVLVSRGVMYRARLLGGFHPAAGNDN